MFNRWPQGFFLIALPLGGCDQATGAATGATQAMETAGMPVIESNAIRFASLRACSNQLMFETAGSPNAVLSKPRQSDSGFLARIRDVILPPSDNSRDGLPVSQKYPEF